MNLKQSNLNNYTTTSTGDYAVNPTKFSKTIKYKAFRGYEEVTEQRRAEIKLYPNFIEVIYDYDLKTQIGQIELRNAIYIAPKSKVSVGVCPYYHEDDKEKINYPRVEVIIDGGYTEYIYVETFEEAYDIYKQIKTWLLNE